MANNAGQSPVPKNRTLKPSEFSVFDGRNRFSGEEFLALNQFDPDLCRIEVKKFGIHFTQAGNLTLVLHSHMVIINDPGGEAPNAPVQ